ncbi:MAG: acid phosphatase [Candidatus Kerfeldbacteria bacterium CG15_BIG_FIL_POST_REV_8_21_14_020_45_12]|uniref:Acid phosphatase n=1 Tax=Candidatus Kerfeldbacteria bacterium CG15_BIG_FIL_POST_REV_8_21_14_020_45_12 TaxID=2014247 RepID=A0A2M7H486_9BACT|nr:MAG: acid phosphatase [Candidatus Kerfeldbacteria bacterium CG15_BIG_FIL_POST_REV_8_21_14_020_45_12]PJA92987.1 MAG: acid phosphatase [Candidatus Kerfeldbacteria bacterium CG_4_9_14_3_um_filter_45_8]
MISLLIHWEILAIPALVLIISQVTKVGLQSLHSSWNWKDFNAYGGMPSSHTALFVSITTVVGLTQGFGSPLFIVSGFIAIAFIRDAVGIRWSLGYHGKVLNHLVETLPAEVRSTFPAKLQERLGHTPVEALVGFLMGALLTTVFHFALLALAA